MNTKLSITLATVGLSALLLTGCSVPAAPTPDPVASAASQPEVQEPVAETSPLIQPFGGVVTYEDGVSVSVSTGAPFQPTDMAVGAEGGTPLVFKVVLTNNSTEPLEPTAFPSATSGGQMASNIADVANPEFGDIGLSPTTTILPGQTIEWYSAFSVADPADVTFEVSPTSFDYDMAIFTTAG